MTGLAHFVERWEFPDGIKRVIRIRFYGNRLQAHSDKVIKWRKFLLKDLTTLSYLIYLIYSKMIDKVVMI